jgi:hypothetical protein
MTMDRHRTRWIVTGRDGLSPDDDGLSPDDDGLSPDGDGLSPDAMD